MKSLILSVASRALMPTLLIVSFYVLWRGHNEPGGGFIGGLVAVLGLVIMSKAEGVRAARDFLRIEPLSLAAIGLGCSVVSGVWGYIVYGTVLKGVWPFITVAADGSKSGLPVGSIFLFDLGVYLVVIGGVLGMLFAMEEVVAPEPDEDETRDGGAG
ncbi:MnhB domain-containing protein [Oceanomicrobium pacificus]|uniref:Na(+)/H(+) antiporter subunit B n=1 Tax=Oceanomicrobium pacificus TaxID=2692916 RepID=A0A6B0TR82_9RHOB|nr:MnhB domain-containing protein [Oceanomicrobium pacificus]MXU63874.1 Na(+)/H(+) antiporter subunit B [Oceanomicrobium pacificus]